MSIDRPPVGMGAPGVRPAPRGRGVAENPPNRFTEIHVELDDDAPVDERPRTVYLEDHARSILVANDSPDVGFRVGLNPYRGCEHGCSYCYARPYHEYLGFSAGLDFETKILVKTDAPVLLEAALGNPRWAPEPIGLSGVTDCYQPVERRLGLTRACLEVLARFRNPVGVITKSALVTRDLDVLGVLARDDAASVCLTVTTLEPDLAARLEPRAARPAARLEAVARLREAGVPVGVAVAPVIPGLTDHEIPRILAAAAEAGARAAFYTVLRLPHAVKELFPAWLERHEPLRRSRVLARLASLRHGAYDDGRFGIRMRGEGPYAEQIRGLFEAGCRRAGLATGLPRLSTRAFRRPEGERQGRLFAC